ncbi:DegT/DnrJ/EryC1/StrS family aminotransferase [Candidatus Wolfebacteria bacterium]|nr:DegT/DnrJ/EryC1/StrS family aminotransferase [Candidatus Wolfebacteria bacterium]
MISFHPTITYQTYREALAAPYTPRALARAFRMMFPNHTSILTDSGRSALALIIETLKLRGTRLALPAFLCNVLLPVLRHYDITPVFIDIDPKTFEPAPESYADDFLARVDAVLLVATYGNTIPRASRAKIRNAGKITIEDYAHVALPREPVTTIHGHARYYSLPKTLSVPDGGLAIFHKDVAPPNLPPHTKTPEFFKNCLKLFNPFTTLVAHLKSLREARQTTPVWKRIEEPSIITKRLLYYFLYENPPAEGRRYCYPFIVLNPDSAQQLLLENGIAAERLWLDPIGLFRTYGAYPNTERAAVSVICAPGWHIHTKEKEKTYLALLKNILTGQLTHFGDERKR